MKEYTHLVGRAGRDPESKTTETGKRLSKFSLAVEVGYDSETKENLTRWYDVTAWEEMAPVISANVRKGSRVWVSGVASVWPGEKGDRDQISVRDFGLVDRKIPASRTSEVKAEATALEGIKPTDGRGGEW